MKIDKEMVMKKKKIEKEIAEVLNINSRESVSNTPDYILAQCLMGCLTALETAIQQRETWYGRDARPSEAVK